MASYRCGVSTPTGPCRRRVARPGSPCGVPHSNRDALGAGRHSLVELAGDGTRPGYLDRLEQAKAWASIGGSHLVEVVNDPEIPDFEIDKMLRSTNLAVRVAAIESSRLTPEQLAKQARSKSTEVVWAVAANSRTSPETLEWLASREMDNPSDIAELRQSVAGNPATTLATLSVGGKASWG